MDIKAIPEKICEIIKKYRYALLVLAIGLVLMVIPGKNDQETIKKSDPVEEVIQTESSLEERMATVLSQVTGAGHVRVILTVSKGEEIVYQTNNDTSSTNDTNNVNSNTVTITDAQRNQNGLIRQVIPAVYQGAVIVCQGADDPTVRLAIVDAVSKLTGLGANCISVLKMK